MSSGPISRHQSSLCVALVGALIAGSSCGDYDPCEEHVGALCDGVWALRPVDVSVDRAVSIDVDGDGRREWALLDLDARAVTIAWAERGRSETYRIGGQARELAALELDGDGEEDLAILCDRPPRLVPLYVRGGELVEGEPLLLADTPLSVVTGDLDGDDRPELLIGHDGAVSVLRGADLSVRVVEVAGAPVALDLADFDGDGALDVAALNLDGASLEVLRGDGEGGLSAMASVSLGPGSLDLDLADLNGDGATDVVVRSRLGELWIVEGDGAGGFAEPWTLATEGGTGYGWSYGAEAARGVLAIPGAGAGEFAVVLPDSLLRMSVRDSSGGVLGDAAVFAERTARVLQEGLVAGYGFAYELTAGAGPSLLAGEGLEIGETRGAIAAGDLNGDGFDDLVALTKECEIEVFAGSSEGLGPAELSGAFFERCPTSLRVAEVTGDEHPDLVGGDLTPEGYEVYLAIGAEDGAFELSPLLTIQHYFHESLQVLPRPEGAALVFLTEPEMSPYPVPVIIEVDAAGVMSFAEPELPELTQMGHGDVDGDGQEDLVLSLPFVSEGAHIQVYYGVGDTYVPGPVHESLMPSPDWSFANRDELLVRDLDGDDRAELVLLSPAGVATITGLDSDLEVVDAHPVEGSFELFLLSGASRLADLDGDGFLDLVRVHRDRIFAVRGASGGRFAAEGALLEFPESIRVTQSDLEGDGRSELLVESVDQPLRRVESHEIGLPALGQSFLLPDQGIVSPIFNAVYGDFDGDGRGDVAEVGVQVLTTLWGDGGAFRRSSSREVPSGRRYSNQATGDLDGDGRDEIFAYEDRYPYQVSDIDVLRWSGDTWEIVDAISVPSGKSPAGILAEDLDGDGVVDLAVSPGASRDTGAIAVYIAYGRLGADGVHELEDPVGVPVAVGSAAAEQYWQLPVSLSSGDLDGDGRPELLVDGSDPDPSYLLWNDGERLWSHVEIPATSAAIGGVGELMVVAPDTIGRIPVYGRRLGDTVTSVHGAPPWQELKIARLDCNGDGRSDLSISQGIIGQLWFAVSQTFVRPVGLPKGVLIHCEDIDGDGVVDLLGFGEKGLWRLLSGGAP